MEDSMKKIVLISVMILTVASAVFADKTYYFYDADANKENLSMALMLYDQKKYDGVRSTTRDMDGNKVIIYAVGISSKNTQYRFFFIDNKILIKTSEFASREMPSYTIPVSDLGATPYTKIYIADLGITFVMSSYKKTQPTDVVSAPWPGEGEGTCMDDPSTGK